MPNMESAIAVHDDDDGVARPAAQPVVAKSVPPAASQFHIGV